MNNYTQDTHSRKMHANSTYTTCINRINTTITLSLFSILPFFSPVSEVCALNYFNPSVHHDDYGNLTAIWQSYDDYINQIQTSSRTVGQPWSSPLTLSDPSLNSFMPSLQMNAQGDCLAAWLVVDPLFTDSLVIVARTKLHNSNEWSPIEVLSAPYEVTNEQFTIAIDEVGNMCVSWKSYNIYSDENSILTRSYSPQIGWLPEVQISE